MNSMDESQDVDSEDVLRIMVATDSHLGYAEKDPIRGEDSFIAFEEMLQHAVEEKVDFILLGGDLFHDAVPSQNSLHRCMNLLRQYTFGNDTIKVEILSDQAVNFYNAVNQTVNYQDPNLNISIPVFSIHGNHDDPIGFGRLSSLDLLATAGLVNYFGRWTDLTKVQIKPILLRKGQTHLALYGLSHIHDARLARLFKNYKVEIEEPGEEHDWFHLMVVHQNRADRGPNNYILEDVLPQFLNLVIWGHEHDCRIEPEYNARQDFYVSQPGSSVATSLAEGEALPKHVGLLKIYKNKFKMQPIPLKTVRPFVFETVNLMDMGEDLQFGGGSISENVQSLAKERIEAMIERANEMKTGHEKQPTWPLIRLCLVFSDEEQMFNTIRFGHMFNGRVANPTDLVHFKKKIKREKKPGHSVDGEAMSLAMNEMEAESSNRVEDLLERYFDNSENGKKLKIMPSKMLTEICFQLVVKLDKNSVENLLQTYKKKAVDYLMNIEPNEEDIETHLFNLKEVVTQDDIAEMLEDQSIGKAGKSTSASVSTVINRRDNPQASTDDTTPQTASRGRGGTRGRGRGRGRGSASNTTSAKSELNISINSSRRSERRQTTLTDLMPTSKPLGRARKAAPVYLISDESD